MSKFTLEVLKPRNPLVAPSRLRRAGAHGVSSGGQRQLAKHALRREINEMHRLRKSP